MTKRFQVYTTLCVTLAMGTLFAAEESEEIQNLKTAGVLDHVANYANGNNAIALASSSMRNSHSQRSNGSAEAAPSVILPTQPCPDHWRLSGDYLYLLPTIDDTYFVLDSSTSTTFPNGKRKNNDFNFHSGFRVGAEYAMCNKHRELQAFYTRLSAHQHHKVSGDHLWATLGSPDMSSSFENYDGSASSKLNLLYQRADANLSQRVLNCYGMYFYLQPGLEFAYFRLKEGHKYFNEANGNLGTINQKSRAWGIGPQIGLEMDYNIYQGTFSHSGQHALSITALFSGSILMSHSKTKETDVLGTLNQIKVKDQRTWRTIPALHARAGLDYVIRGASAGFNVGIGYEFNTYIRALTRTIFPDDVADSLNFNNYYNFDVQGLYVNAAVSF